MVPVKSAVVATGLPSVKLPTPTPTSATPVFPVCSTVAPAVSGASAMVAVEAPETVIGVVPPLSVTDTTTWYVPSSGRVNAGALTVNWLALAAWVMLAAANVSTSVPPESKIVDGGRIFGDRVGAAGVDEGGDRGRGDGDALGADEREGGDGQWSLGHGGRGRSARGGSGRAEGDRDRYAVNRHGVGAAGEGDRVVDGVGAVLGEGVGAGDVVDAGVAGILGDGAGAWVGRRIAPVDRCGEVAGGEARRAREGRGSGAVKVPTIESTFWKPSTRVDGDRRPGGDDQWAGVGDVDHLIVDGVDDAGAGDGDEYLARKEAGRDARHLAAGVVVQGVGRAAAVQEQDGAVGDAQAGDACDVFVGAAVEGGDDAGRGVDEGDVVVAVGGGVEGEVARPSDGIGMLTVPIMPDWRSRGSTGGVLNDDVRSCWRRRSSRSWSGSEASGVLANWMVGSRRRSGRSLALNDWSG